jgi:hypothetical protein
MSYAFRSEICARVGFEVSHRWDLAEREDVGPDGGARNVNLHVRSVIGPPLSNQLIEPVLRHRSAAVFVDVEPMGVAGRLSVDEHAERYGPASRARSHDEMDVAFDATDLDPEGPTRMRTASVRRERAAADR